MILNNLQSLSWSRLLHVALSLLCVLALVLGLASGALAVAGDPDGRMNDFLLITNGSTTQSIQTIYSPGYSQLASISAFSSTAVDRFYFSFIWVFPSPVLSGDVWPYTSFLSGCEGFQYRCFDSDGLPLSALSSFTPIGYDIYPDAGTRFLLIRFRVTIASPATYYTTHFSPADVEYFDFVYDTSVDSGDLDDVLSGLTAIAQSLLDLETGPYSGVSGVTVDANGDLQHTVVSSASLEDLLNALGIAGTDTNHVLRGIYNNFGSYFTLYSINDTTSSTTQIYRGLPQYVNALGQTVTDGINRLQRDHDLLYQQTADLASHLDDALYADTDTTPSQSWSVAEWLKGIYSSITSFFLSFWSPAETELKESAEEGMQEAADRDIAGSADQVGDMDDLGSGFASFGNTGNVGAGDLLDSLTGGDYSFFSSTTQQNLAYQPSQQNRGFRSAPPDPDQVEYVDELSEKRDLLREVFGLP